jgi:hypothetical protein
MVTIERIVLGTVADDRRQAREGSASAGHRSGEGVVGTEETLKLATGDRHGVDRTVFGGTVDRPLCIEIGGGENSGDACGGVRNHHVPIRITRHRSRSSQTVLITNLSQRGDVVADAGARGGAEGTSLGATECGAVPVTRGAAAIKQTDFCLRTTSTHDWLTIKRTVILRRDLQVSIDKLVARSADAVSVLRLEGTVLTRAGAQLCALTSNTTGRALKT